MTKRREACQVGSGTDHPCPHRAMVEIRGVPFCTACARKQEDYFAVGRRVAHASANAQEGLEWVWEGIGLGTRRTLRQNGRALGLPYIGGGSRVSDRRGPPGAPEGEDLE
jgi:hypothetical protein